MKTILYILILVLGSTYCFSQNKNFKHDNSNLILSEFQRCEKFYNHITQSLPAKLYRNNQLEYLNFINNNAEISNQEKNSLQINSNKTFALNNSEFNSFIKYLKQKRIEFTNRKGQLNTVNTSTKAFKQIYIQNLDGYTIEINNSKN